MDDRLHPTGHAGAAGHEHEFAGLVLHQRTPVHVHQNVNAVFGQQNLVNFKHPDIFFKGNDFQRPGVGADGHPFFRSQVERAVLARTRLARKKPFVVLAFQRLPAGREQRLITLVTRGMLIASTHPVQQCEWAWSWTILPIKGKYL